MAVDPGGLRADFQAVVADYLAEVREALGAQRGHHILAPTDKPMDRPLASLIRGMP